MVSLSCIEATYCNRKRYVNLLAVFALITKCHTVTARDTVNLLAVFALITKRHTWLFSSGLLLFLSCNLVLVAGLVITESGLPGVLFSMLDTETDNRLIKDIHDTLTSMLQMMAADNLSQWLSLCKDVLTVATG